MAQRSNKPQASALKQFCEFASDDLVKIARDGTPHFFGRTDLNRHGFSSDGVAVFQLGAGQVQSCACVQGRGAVDEVAHHGVPHGCGVSSDLVGASCLDGPFHQRGAAMHSPTSGAQHAERRSTWFAVDGKSATSRFRELVSNHPAVVRLDHAGPLRLEGRHHFRAPSHHHGPSGSVVQPMHRFGTFWKCCATRQTGAEVLPSSPVGGHPGLFQHDCMGVVLMQYVQGLVHGQLDCANLEMNPTIWGIRPYLFAIKPNPKS